MTGGLFAISPLDGVTAQVASWRLVDGSGKKLAEATTTNFETALSVPEGATRLRAEALGAGGHVLGTSARAG